MCAIDMPCSRLFTGALGQARAIMGTGHAGEPLDGDREEPTPRNWVLVHLSLQLTHLYSILSPELIEIGR